MGKLEGKRILVAGSARNIGKKTAERLAEEGAELFLGDINEEEVKKVAASLGAGSGWFNLDDAKSIEKLVKAAVEHLGGLDGIANVAANISPKLLEGDVDILGMEPEIWNQTLNSNLVGFALIIKHALPDLIKSDSAAVVNVSSGTYFLGEETRPAYASSKAGVNALTRHVATKWGKDNITCNAVSPGLVLTDTSSDLVTDEFVEDKLKNVPMPRLGEPKDIANAITFFLSDEAEWITGQVLNVNGGGHYRD